MKTAFLIPKPGLMVRDPASMDILPPEGFEKELTTYWRRRIKCGDVYIKKETRKNKKEK